MRASDPPWKFGTIRGQFEFRRVLAAMAAFSLMLLSLVPAWSQEPAQPSTYAGFDGKNVSRVDISIRPEMDTGSFAQMINQKAHQPFSTTAIRESVAALQNTHLFSKIDVSVTPELAGLRVLFVLQPAYYVGLISFPGATKRFPYTQLLQAVNVPEQSPFTDDLLPQGQKALLHFFQTEGYFLAAVEPHAETDDAHRIVILTFDVKLSRVARIGALNFHGIPESEAVEIRAALRSWWAKLKRDSLKPGRAYSQGRINRSVDFIRAHLRKSGRLAPVVQVASVSYRPETNHADLTFQVDPGPLFSVRVSGAHLSSGKLKKLVPIFEENSIDEDLVAEGQRNITSYFQSKGYFNAKVDFHLDRQPDKVSVTYEVDRGTRHKVEAVYFQGNRYFDDDRLKVIVAVKKAHFLSRGSYSADLVRKSSDAILALYKNEGFAGVKVETKIDDFDPQVDVTFAISEGPQDRVHSIRVTGNSTQSLSALLGKHSLRLQPGKPYSLQALQDDRNQILAGYLNRGYQDANFRATASPEDGNPHLVNVVYNITEGPHTRIGDVVLLGAKQTKPSFVRQIVGPGVTPGQPLSTGKMLAAESNLYGLDIFDWASIQSSQPVTDQTESTVLEKVHEAPRNTIDYGGGIEVIPRSGNVPVGTVALPGLPPIGLGNQFRTSQNSYWGPRGSFDFTHRNIFGRAESFTASTVVSRLDQRLSFSFSNPHFRGSSWSSNVSLSGERTTENPIFAAEVGIASFQLQRPLDAKKTRNLILRYDFDRTILSNITIPNLVLPQDQHVRLSTFSIEYTRDTRDKPLDAHKGIYQVFDFGVTPTALGSSANYVRFLGQTAFYIPVRPWLTWANNFRLGFAIPFADSRVPLSQEFFSGGADSLRGFPINGAGPQRPVQVCSNPSDASTCTLISVPVGGESLFIFNTEARFPIPIGGIKGLGGVVFYDGGNVYAHVNLPQMVNNYTNTIGIGLRYNTPVGPVRIDIGHNLNPVPGVNSTQYFVTLGQAF